MEQTEIRLKKLRLENFKGARCEIFAFEGRNAAVYGDNAAGKTTIYDGLTWLLFGKDSRGQKDFDIKPLDSQGNVADHAAITEVEAEFIVSGTPLLLKRTYYEKWSTKRGSSEKSFDGHSSDYFVDGVPCKKNEFERRVEEVVAEDKFRLLTSVSYFPEVMSWQDRREVLFGLAGIHSDREILATDSRFAPLMDAIWAGTMEDYKKRLKAERSGLNTSRTDIPARIAENQERIRQLEALDFTGMEARAEDLRSKREGVLDSIRQAGSGALLDAQRVKLGSIRNDIQRLTLENNQYRSQQAQTDNRGQIAQQLTQEKYNVEFYARRIRMLDSQILSTENRLTECRIRWNRYNDMAFQGGICKACGQTLPQTALERAQAAFEAEKQQGKDKAVSDSQEAKAALESLRKEFAEFSQLEDAARTKVLSLEKQLEKLQSQIQPTIEDMPGYAAQLSALQEQADTVSSQIFQLESDQAQQTTELKAKARELEAQLTEVNHQLAKKGLLADLTARVEQLRQDARAAADALNAVDRMLSLCDDFTRYKVSFVEDTVNSLFSLAKFRLYREQLNGGVEDRCDVTYGGIPYGSLNNGARINVGLDIIRTLSRAYGISVPLFIDNAESVTKLESIGSQIIRLIVSENDKKLRCEYEN